MVRKQRVPAPTDPVGFDQFLVSMEAYWRYWWTLRKGGLKKKFTLGAVILFALDYLKLRLLTWLL